MMNPLVLEQLVKEHQRELLREAELWRRTHPAKTAGPGPLKRFMDVGDTLLKKIAVWGKQETPSADEHLILNSNA